MARKRKADQEKIKKILEKRGYKNGEPPRGYEVHHIKPLVERGKDTPKNIRVIKRKNINKYTLIAKNGVKFNYVWKIYSTTAH